MEDFSAAPGIKPGDLIQAQQCHLYLNVTTLADICNSKGTDICAWAMNGQANPRPSITTYPQQAKPAPHAWAIWRCLLRITYCQSKDCKLDRPMGRWYIGNLNQIWDTVINLTTALLYVWRTVKVKVYEKHGQGHKWF
jgi:hypothetical protein